jgi:hypothetical protein
MGASDSRHVEATDVADGSVAEMIRETPDATTAAVPSTTPMPLSTAASRKDKKFKIALKKVGTLIILLWVTPTFAIGAVCYYENRFYKSHVCAAVVAVLACSPYGVEHTTP